jgi:Aldo/keto reductase family
MRLTRAGTSSTVRRDCPLPTRSGTVRLDDLSWLIFSDTPVSLAWIQSRPGVTSTIIGARTMKQLDSNLAALELPLSADHVERLDKLSEPKLNFPAQYMHRAPAFSHAGATVNGIESMLLPFAPKDLEDHY